MRPPSVYAKPSCPADDACDLLGLLHGPHRVGCRLVMILLSQQGVVAAEIAGLLGYDPCTVRRWIHRYQQDGAAGLADRPRSGRPRLGSPTLGRQADPPAARPAQGLDHPQAVARCRPPDHEPADPAPARW
jgi:hypothetical protein